MAEQQGRLVRTRSFLAWGGRGAATLRPGAARDEFMAAVAEEECLGSRRQTRSPAEGEIRLAARILRATKIPQGLVLWPDAPFIRVTAAVDGLDVGCQEKLLNSPSSGPPAASGESIEADEEGNSKTGSSDETQPETHVLEMQLPKIPAGAVADHEERGASLPTLSLRVEVLVGRVVTASGTVDLSDELKASLTGSSTRRALLNLTGGGEILIVVDLNRQVALSATAGGLHQARTGMPTTVQSAREGGRSDMNGGSLGAGSNTGRLERFLDGIASWGLEGGSSSPVLSRAAQTSSIDLAKEQRFGVGKEEKRPIGSVEQDGSSFTDLVNWLGRSHPDPTFLRSALEKTNSYAFPLVEAPFLAALLKHGGLVGEAFQAAEMLSTWDKGESIHAANGSFQGDVTCLIDGHTARVRKHFESEVCFFVVMELKTRKLLTGRILAGRHFVGTC